jgi:hypothetical protein
VGDGIGVGEGTSVGGTGVGEGGSVGEIGDGGIEVAVASFVGSTEGVATGDLQADKNNSMTSIKPRKSMKNRFLFITDSFL